MIVKPSTVFLPLGFYSPWLLITALAGSLSVPNFLMLTAVLLISVLLHEIGHGLIATLVGAKVLSITLSWSGGYILMKSKFYAQDFLSTLAGPLASALIAYGAYQLAGPNPAWFDLDAFLMLPFRLLMVLEPVALLQWICVINAIFAVMNLIPFRGTDGAQILFTFTRLLTPKPTAVKS